MTLTALSDFIDFCIQTYETNKELLMQKWKVHQKYFLPDGICEMSLLYLWIKQTGIKVKNIGLRTGDKLPVIIVNGKGMDYSGSRQYLLEERMINSSCVKNGIPCVVEADTGKRVRVYNLHFG